MKRGWKNYNPSIPDPAPLTLDEDGGMRTQRCLLMVILIINAGNFARMCNVRYRWI